MQLLKTKPLTQTCVTRVMIKKRNFFVQECCFAPAILNTVIMLIKRTNETILKQRKLNKWRRTISLDLYACNVVGSVMLLHPWKSVNCTLDFYEVFVECLRNVDM